MSNWQHANPANLPGEARQLLHEVRDALGDLTTASHPVLVGAGTDGHIRLILGAPTTIQPEDASGYTTEVDLQTAAQPVVEEAVLRLAAAGLRMTVDPEKLAEGYYVRVARRTGRPEVGRMVQVRMPDEMLAQVDERAKQTGASRAAVIRDLVAAGLPA